MKLKPIAFSEAAAVNIRLNLNRKFIVTSIPRCLLIVNLHSHNFNLQQ